jgi:spore maturation protein CgeB
MNKFLAYRNQLSPGKFLEVLPSVPFEEVNAIYSNHALSLNITELRNTFNLKHPIHKLHLRTFEIAMSGGLQIAPYVEELASYFKDDEEIVLCRDDEEFVSKALFYLRPQNESLRMKMKQNARKRAEADHTWNNRFNVVFGKLFGSS